MASVLGLRLNLVPRRFAGFTPALARALDRGCRMAVILKMVLQSAFFSAQSCRAGFWIQSIQDIRPFKNAFLPTVRKKNVFSSPRARSRLRCCFRFAGCWRRIRSSRSHTRPKCSSLCSITCRYFRACWISAPSRSSCCWWITLFLDRAKRRKPRERRPVSK